MSNVWRWLIVILLVRESFCTTELNIDLSLSDPPPLSIPDIVCKKFILHVGQITAKRAATWNSGATRETDLNAGTTWMAYKLMN
jgi:hypothetical protein